MTFSRFLLRRFLMAIPLLVGIVFVTFMLVRVGGLDPVGRLAGPTATAEEFDMIRSELGSRQTALAAVCVSTWGQRVAGRSRRILAYPTGPYWTDLKEFGRFMSLGVADLGRGHRRP